MNNSFKLDDTTNVRVVCSGDTELCHITENTSFNRNSKWLYLNFNVLYFPTFSIYYAVWSINSGSVRYDNSQQHRLEIIEWDGGYAVSKRTIEHFNEAISFAISSILSDKVGNIPFNLEKMIVTPNQKLEQEFIKCGWRK